MNGGKTGELISPDGGFLEEKAATIYSYISHVLLISLKKKKTEHEEDSGDGSGSGGKTTHG